MNAMAAATEIMIPLQMEFFALRGISKLLQIVRLVQDRINPKVEITGIIPCMYDPRRRLSQDVLTEVTSFFQDKVYQTKIRTNVRIAEAPSHGKAIVEYDAECHGTEDYRSLAREMLIRAGEDLPVEEPTAVTSPAPPLDRRVEGEGAETGGAMPWAT